STSHSARAVDGCEPGFATHSSVAGVEAITSGRPLRPHSLTSGRDHRTALHSAFHHQPLVAGLVCDVEARSDPIPFLCAIQHRIFAGPVQFSGLSGTPVFDTRPGAGLVRLLRSLRFAMHSGGVENFANASAHNEPRP